MSDPVASVHVAINQAIACFCNTMTTLNYGTGNLHLRDKLIEFHAGTKQSEPKSDMTGIISQLIHQAHMIRDQVIKAAWIIWESREWLVARDWELVNFKMKEAIRTLMNFRHKVNRITLKES